MSFCVYTPSIGGHIRYRGWHGSTNARNCGTAYGMGHGSTDPLHSSGIARPLKPYNFVSSRPFCKNQGCVSKHYSRSTLMWYYTPEMGNAANAVCCTRQRYQEPHTTCMVGIVEASKTTPWVKNIFSRAV
jgi:hypothetical protein